MGLVGGGDGCVARGASWPATQRASRLAKVPPLERWPRCCGQSEHLGERGDGFDLHGGAGAAAVEGVVVGVDRHGQRVGGAGDGVGRLQHLAGVEGVGVGVVVLEALGGLLEDGGGGFAECGRGFGGRWAKPSSRRCWASARRGMKSVGWRSDISRGRVWRSRTWRGSRLRGRAGRRRWSRCLLCGGVWRGPDR